MKPVNGNEMEVYNERLTRIARHIRDTNKYYVPKPISHYLKERPLTCCDLESIMDRISVATRNSRIMVIKNDRGLRCFFANTVAGWYYLEYKRKEVVGVYDSLMDRVRIREELMQY